MSMTPESEEDRLGQLSQRIEDWLRDSSTRAQTLRELVAEVRREQSLSPRPSGPAVTAASRPADAGDELARFSRGVERASDQAGILGCLIEGSASAASRVVLFIVRGESVIGWASRGFTPGFSPRSVSFPLTGNNLLTRSHQSCAMVIEPPSARTGNAELLMKLGGSSPNRLLAAPLWVRDRVAAVLYADTGDSGGPWMPDSLCLMSTLASLNLEVLPARQKHRRPVAEPEITVGESDTRSPSTIECDELPARIETQPAEQERMPDPEAEVEREEALRFARLLACEIVLYNAADLEEGRLNKNIYERLKDEIDRSHQMFQERFSSREPGTKECFRKELVRVLAEGDESALTLPWS